MNINIAENHILSISAFSFIKTDFLAMYYCRWGCLFNAYSDFEQKRTAENTMFSAVLFCGTPGWIRTSGLQSRSLSLYPTELRAHLYKTWITHTSLSSIARFSPSVNPFFKNFFNFRLLKNLTSPGFCVKLHLRIF